MLLLADLFLILVFLSHRLYGWPSSHYFNIGIDRSIPELFQYVKQLAMAAVLCLIFIEKRALVALLWAAISLLMFFDDAFQAHEKLGTMISELLSLSDVGGIRGQDFGEVAAAGLLATPLLLGVAFCYIRDTPFLRRFSRNLFYLLVLLGLFGVVIDLFVHSLQSLALYVIEDGGEMIVISLMLYYVWSVYMNMESRADL
jgi:hypothetical protein